MPEPMIYFIIAYFLIMNIIGYAIMGVDKAKAKQHVWRIPEATLFSIAILGGSVGSIFGMFHFRHKTKHWYFVAGMPIIFFVQLAIAVSLTT